MEKTLSIIVPTYNMDKYLRKCLDSLIVSDENMQLLEVLVINDGSKDSSSQIAHEYEAKYPQTFRVIDKENGNYGSCINRGLKEATGKYVKVLDADDYFDRKNFISFVSYLKGVDTDLILTDYDMVDMDGKRIDHISYSINSQKIIRFVDVCRKNCILNISMHGITYNTQLFLKLNYVQSEGISYTDQEWIFTPMSQVKTISYYPITIYKYLVGREGQTMDPSVLIKNISHTVKGIYKMCDDYCQYKMESIEDTRFYVNYIIKKRFKYVYVNYLLTHPELPIDELIIFDKEIKKRYKQLYELTNEIVLTKKIPIRFVKIWRSYGLKRNMFIIKVFHFFK